MNTISYQINQTSGEITWAASEYFGELSGKTYKLDAMEATNIEQIPNLSITAKLLLSAIAGAIIQHLLDQGLPAKAIFQSGTFTVKPWAKLNFFFVRSGFIHSDSTLYYPGHDSYYWSRNSISADGAFDLSFNSANVYPSRTAGRYAGLSLRCLHP